MSGRVEIVFETHSLTTDNERGIATGWLSGALSERGRALAAELGDRRRDDGIELVLASDLARAVETARIAFAASSLPVRHDRRLREIDYGNLNGAPVAVVAAERPQRVDVPFPGGESYRDVVRRVGSLLAELRAEQAGSRVLLIGHTATRWALDHLLAGRALEDVVAEPFAWREGWEYALGEPLEAQV